MFRRVILVLLSLVVLGGVTGVAIAVGFYLHKLRVEPVYSLAERAETKLRRELGLKSSTELEVERIETIFLTLRGRVHVMPGRDFHNGGALTVWGDDLIVLHKSGKVFWLGRDETEGLVRSGLILPDNGSAGYAELAARDYPGRTTRIDGLRYNDIEYIETPERRGLLLSYTFVNAGDACYQSRVAWLPLAPETATIRDANTRAEDWEMVYQSQPCLPFNETGELMLAYMAGGRIAFKAPNLVYLGNGDYHLDGIYRPDVGIQSDDIDYGKTIEINLDTGFARHFSKGHRNLQGVTLDRDGRLWTTEHGMRGGDELNLVVDGENYGWPIENMGTLYSGVPAPSPSGPGRHTTYRAPVYAWVPSAAVSSVAQINGFHDAWDGDLLITSLKARTLFRARIQDERLVSLEPIFIGQRIRDVMQWGDDRIALWLDWNEIIILEAEQRVDPLEGLEEQLVSGGMEPGLAGRAADTLAGCAECHSYEADIHGAGPSLAGVVGRRVASTGFESYSDALRGLPGDWSPDRLTDFLADPEVVVPGTAMSGFGLGDPALAAAVVEALSTVHSAGD